MKIFSSILRGLLIAIVFSACSPAPAQDSDRLPSPTASQSSRATVAATQASATVEHTPYPTIPAPPELSEEMQRFLEFTKGRFPLAFNEGLGTYDLVCVVERINYLEESEYITIGDDEITVTGECTYYDADDQRQTITVALAVQNRNKRATWIADFALNELLIGPNHIEGYFESRTDIEEGALLTVGFGLPNDVNAGVQSEEHNNNIITTLYDEESVESYASTGNPDDFNNLVIPFYVESYTE